MKLKKILILTLPLLLVSCGETNATSSSDSTPTITDNSNTTDIETSNTSTVKTASDTFKEALHYMASQDKMEADFSSDSIHFDVKGTATQVNSTYSSGDGDGDGTGESDAGTPTTLADDETGGETTPSEDADDTTTSITPINIDATLTKFTTRVAMEGLKEATDTSKINGYMLLQSSVNFKYGFTTADAFDDTITANSAYLRAYLESTGIYADLNNSSLLSLIGEIPTYGTTIASMLKISPYVCLSEGFSYNTDSLPILNVTNDQIDAQLDESTLSLISNNSKYDATNNVYQFNMTVTDGMLDLLPAAYKVDAEGKLDKESDTYEADKAAIAEKAEFIKGVTDKTTINKCNITMTYDETGIKSVGADVDIKISDYSYTYNQTTQETITDTTVDVTEANFVSKSDLEFKYGDDVTVNKKPSDKTFIDISNML